MFLYENSVKLWSVICEWLLSWVSSRKIVFDNISITVASTVAIGEGAFSVVYKGTNNNQSYAIKKMLIQSKEQDQMVKREINAFQRFQHENILRLLAVKESYESNIKTVYLLFPYIENGSLRDLLQRVACGKQTKPSISEVLHNFIHICKAINVLHQHEPSYVHHDIKPEVF